METVEMVLEDFSITCRTCLSTRPIEVSEREFTHLDSYMLESLTYLDCLNFCTNLGISTSDNLPIHICEDCSNALEISYDFVKKSKNADDILRANLLVDVEDEKEHIDLEEPYISAPENLIEFCDIDDRSKYNIVISNKECENGTKIEDTIVKDKKWICKICSKEQISRKHYEAHVNKHLGISPYKCTMCSYEGRYKQTIKRHYKTKHLIDPAKELLETAVDFVDVDEYNIPVVVDSSPTQLLTDSQQKECSSVIIYNNENTERVDEISQQTYCSAAVIYKSEDTQGVDEIYHEESKISLGTLIENSGLHTDDLSQTKQPKFLFKSNVIEPSGIPPFKCSICSFTCQFKCSIVRHYKGKHKIQPTADMIRSNIESPKKVSHSKADNIIISGNKDESILKSDIKDDSILKSGPDYSSKDMVSELKIDIKQENTNQAHSNYNTSFKCTLCSFCCRYKCTIVRHYKGKHKIQPTTKMLKPIESVDITSDTNDSCNSQTKVMIGNENQEDDIDHTRSSVKLSTSRVLPKKQNKVFGYKCPKCTYAARSKLLVVKHLHEEHKNMDNEPKGERTKKYNCEECENSYMTTLHLRRHIKKCHPNGKQYNAMVMCDICGVECRAMMLETHKRSHQDRLDKKTQIKPMIQEKSYACSTCPKRFRQKHTLQFHEKYTHLKNAEKIFQCDMCPSKFKCKVYLSRHMSTVHIQRKLKCHICGHLYKLPSQLRDHMKRHSERIYRCQLCGKSYVRPLELKVHMRLHTGERPYQCTMCNQSFILAARLRTHISVNHSNETTKCLYCSKEFKGAKTTKYYNHIYQHTGMPYKCEICNSEHGKKEAMRRHMKTVHKMEISNEDLINMYHRNTGRFAKQRLQHIYKTNRPGQEILGEEQLLESILYDVEDDIVVSSNVDDMENYTVTNL